MPTDLNDVTQVELLWIEKRIENRIRFGHIIHQTILDGRRRRVSFAPGSIFAFVRWAFNEYGTVVSRIHILRAVAPGERYSTVPFVQPGGVSTAGRKSPKTSGLKLLRRPHLSVDLMVANNGWTAGSVKAVSRRRRGPKARLYRVRRAAKLGHQVDGGQLPSATQPGNFKPLVFGAFRAAANTSSATARSSTGVVRPSAFAA